jgi:hypothetical protein
MGKDQQYSPSRQLETREFCANLTGGEADEQVTFDERQRGNGGGDWGLERWGLFSEGNRRQPVRVPSLNAVRNPPGVARVFLTSWRTLSHFTLYACGRRVCTETR